MSTGWQDGDTIDLANIWRGEKGRFAEKGYTAVPKAISSTEQFADWLVNSNTGPLPGFTINDIAVVGERSDNRRRRGRCTT